VLAGTTTSSGEAATVVLDDPADFSGTIAGFARGDTVDFRTLASATTSASISGSTLTVHNGGSTYAIALGAPISGHDALALSADGSGGTDLRLVPLLTEHLTSDSGISNTDQLTNDPSLTGTADPNSTVIFSEDSKTLGSGTTDGTGAFTFLPMGLAQGANTITATETDGTGTNTGSTALSFTLDTIPPDPPSGLALTSASDSGIVDDDITNVGLPVITGTGEAGDIVTLLDGATAIGSGTVAALGDWAITATTPLTEGANALTATQIDPAGNISAPSDPLDVTLKTVPPSAPTGLALTSASDTGIVGDDITNDITPVITGTSTGSAGDVVDIYATISGNPYNSGNPIGSGSVLSGGNWNVDITTALRDGGYSLTAKETDVAGNVSSSSSALNLTIDIALPAAPSGLALTSASDSGIVGDDITNDTLPTIIGSGGVNGDVITLFADGVQIGSDTASGVNWSITSDIGLADGGHVITATDTYPAAGNVSAPSTGLDVTIQTSEPPTPTITNLTDGVDDITSDTTPGFFGTGTNGNTISLFNGATLLGSTTVSNGTWTIRATTTPLGPGVHTLVAKETDTVGNVSGFSSSFQATIVLAAITQVTTAAVSGSAEPNLPVALFDGTTVVGGTSAGSDGSWSIPTTLAPGTHELTTNAGNVGASPPVATVIGTAGNDILHDGGGFAFMDGGAGTDSYYVDHTGDVVTGGPGSDTVFASVNYALTADAQITFLKANAGTTGVSLTGNSFTSGITGGAGNDTLDPGDGVNETLTGGLGNDVFKLSSFGFGHDIITDFTPQNGLPAANRDLIDISGLGITAATFASSVQIASAAGGGTNITFAGHTDSILLRNVSVANIDSTDFRLTS
jgi:large repetitive protein